MRISDWSSDVCSSDLQVFAGFLVHALHGQLHLAAVHADALHLHGVAFLHHVGNGVDALRRQLADVDEAVARTQEVHEGAEVDHLHYLAVVDLADLRLRHDRADRKSVVEGKSVSVRVDLGGRRRIKKKKKHKDSTQRKTIN